MRLFVALEPAPSWVEAAAVARARLEGALSEQERAALRWVAPERLHLTLRFIGEVDAGRAEAIEAALRNAPDLAAVDLDLGAGSLGAFGSARNPRTLWLALEGDVDALQALAAAVETAVVSAGLPAEERPFRPHLTLARVREQARPEQRRAIAEAIAAVEVEPAAPERLREVVLVRSHLGGPAPRYEVLARFPPSHQAR